jgi:type II secretory pathway component PulF
VITKQALSYRVRAELYTQLAQMESAGLPFDRAFSVLAKSHPARARVEMTQKLLRSTGDLAQSGERAGLFTKLDASLIRVSVNSGSPAKTYHRLASYYTVRAMQTSTMRSRMALPAFILIAALFIQPLPALIGGAISKGAYLWGIVSPLLVLALLYFGLRAFLSRDGRSAGKSFYQSLPLYGPIYIRRNMRDFFESLALLLDAGVDMLRALPIALETVEDGQIRRELTLIGPRMQKGQTFTDAARQCKYVGDTALTMIHTGESSGTLPELLLRHTGFETETINNFYAQLAAWLPRAVYAIIAMWMAYGLISGGGFRPPIPPL